MRSLFVKVYNVQAGPCKSLGQAHEFLILKPEVSENVQGQLTYGNRCVCYREAYQQGSNHDFSKKKCFSIALGHTLVVLEMH